MLFYETPIKCKFLKYKLKDNKFCKYLGVISYR